MPLFFLISGYFLSGKAEDKRGFAAKKARRLLVPYALTAFFIILLGAARGVVFERSSKIAAKIAYQFAYAAIYASGVVHREPFFVQGIGPIWFLTALFWGILIVKSVLASRHSAVIIGLLFYIGWKTSQFIWLPLNIQAGLCAALFIYLGYCARKHRVLEMRFSTITKIGMLILWIFCIVFSKGHIQMVQNTYSNGLLDILGALSASLLIVLACIKLQGEFPRIMAPLCYFGKYSFIALCAHGVELTVFPWDRFNTAVQSFAPKGTTALILLAIIAKFLMAFTGIFLVKHIPVLSACFGIPKAHVRKD